MSGRERLTAEIGVEDSPVPVRSTGQSLVIALTFCNLLVATAMLFLTLRGVKR